MGNLKNDHRECKCYNCFEKQSASAPIVTALLLSSSFTIKYMPRKILNTYIPEYTYKECSYYNQLVMPKTSKQRNKARSNPSILQEENG